MRATLPSKVSKTIARNTAKAAVSKRCWAASVIAEKPANMEAVVSKLGSK